MRSQPTECSFQTKPYPCDKKGDSAEVVETETIRKKSKNFCGVDSVYRFSRKRI